MTEELPGDAAGVDLPPLREWFATHVPDFVPDTAVQIAGGHSNITVRLSSADGRDLVLRRPPLHSVLATAHDMGREYRLISAFVPTPLPVPRTLAYCPDDDVIGAPFYIMEYVDGLVLHNHEVAQQLSEGDREKAALSFIDALVELHAADVDEIGLGDLAKREEYIARQLKRWYAQYEHSRTSDDETVERGTRCSRRASPRSASRRSCTATSGWATASSASRATCGPCSTGRSVRSATRSPTSGTSWRPGRRTRSRLRPSPMRPRSCPASRSARCSSTATRPGRVVTCRRSRFYVAFSYFRLACIIQGVYSRALGGAQGDTDDDVDLFRTRSESSARLAEELAGAL